MIQYIYTHYKIQNKQYHHKSEPHIFLSSSYLKVKTKICQPNKISTCTCESVAQTTITRQKSLDKIFCRREMTDPSCCSQEVVVGSVAMARIVVHYFVLRTLEEQYQITII